MLWNWSGKAYLWDAGTVTDLGPNVTPTAINNLGQVVGYVGQYESMRAFVWEKGVMTLLSTLHSEARDINDRGHIVGRTYDGKTHAVLWQADEVIDVTPPTDYPLVDAIAMGINESGAVLGIYQEAGPRPNGLGYVYTDGVFTRLEGSTPGEFAALEGMAINDHGEIAGITRHPWGSPDQARVWSLACFGACCEHQ